MDYSKEEIAYVDFCVNNLSCLSGRRKCPIYDHCYESGECGGICEGIPSRMENGEVLSEEDGEIINFFFTTKGLWEPEDGENACQPKGGGKPCPDFEMCEEREAKGQEMVCTGLVQRVTGKWKMLERSIQELIVADLIKSVVDWHLGETLEFHRSWEKTEIGETDILLIGKQTHTLYIVELKYPIAYREHVGQLASYIGWYKKHPEVLPEQTEAVKGILLAGDFSEGAKFALAECPDLEPKQFDLHVEINPVE